MGSFGYSDKFIKFYLYRLRIPILGILNEKHHEEGHDRRPGIDHELPSVAKSKYRTCNDPHHDYRDRQKECPGLTAKA